VSAGRGLFPAACAVAAGSAQASAAVAHAVLRRVARTRRV
jgi:hypothetical protein